MNISEEAVPATIGYILNMSHIRYCCVISG